MSKIMNGGSDIQLPVNKDIADLHLGNLLVRNNSGKICEVNISVDSAILESMCERYAFEIELAIGTNVKLLVDAEEIYKYFATLMAIRIEYVNYGRSFVDYDRTPAIPDPFVRLLASVGNAEYEDLVYVPRSNIPSELILGPDEFGKISRKLFSIGRANLGFVIDHLFIRDRDGSWEVMSSDNSSGSLLFHKLVSPSYQYIADSLSVEQVTIPKEVIEFTMYSGVSTGERLQLLDKFNWRVNNGK